MMMQQPSQQDPQQLGYSHQLHLQQQQPAFQLQQQSFCTLKVSVG